MSHDPPRLGLATNRPRQLRTRNPTLRRIFATLRDDDRHMTLSRKLLALLAAVVAPLTMVGVSAAMEGDPPEEEAPPAEAGELPEEEVVDDEEVVEDDEVVEEEEVVEDEVLDDEEGGGEAGPPADTHGAAVSAAAKSCPPGPEHGPCVREVARSKGGDDTDEESGDEPEDEVEDEVEEDAAEEVTDDVATSGGGGKGGPPAGRGRR
jgi:hypothetical protein